VPTASRSAVDRPRPDGLDDVGLHLGYHDRAVVHGADIRLRAGRVTALVGPNSSGKSTLLRAPARLHRPTAGELVLQSGNHRVDALAPGARSSPAR
jgi:iron complex transport system ATP-binding protein